jgi:hypothetical protein
MPLWLHLTVLLARPAAAKPPPPPETISPYLGLWIGDQNCGEEASRVGIFFKESKAGFDAVFYGRPIDAKDNVERSRGKAALRAEKDAGTYAGELAFQNLDPFKDVLKEMGVKGLRASVALAKRERRTLEFTIKADSFKAAGFVVRGLGTLAEEEGGLDYFIMIRTPFHTRRCDGSLARAPEPGKR